MFDYWGEVCKQAGWGTSEFVDELMEKIKGYYYEAKASANQGMFDFNTHSMDEKYLALVASGDLEGASEMVVRRAAEMGYEVPEKHEMPNADTGMMYKNGKPKSIAPVTYDKEGNIIPLSKRFDERNSDTNFSAEWEYELASIRQRAEADGTFMKAPNGEKSQLSERLWCVVRTKAFKAWFGDWENDPENASKVVDENGEPLVVYHGTEKNFGNVFRDVHSDEDFENDDFGLLSANTFWFADKKFTAQTYQVGVFVPQGKTKSLTPAQHGSILISKENTDFFFVRCPNRGPWTDGKRITASEALKKNGRLKKNCVAFLYLKKGASIPSGYQGLNGRLMSWSHWHDVALPRTHEEAVEKWNSFNEIQEMLAPEESRLYEVFLNIRNPKVVDMGGDNFRGTGNLASRARSEGYDGLIVENVRDPRSYPYHIENGRSIAVFASNNIKSATDNRGTFDAKSDRIDMSLEEERARELTFEGGMTRENAVSLLEKIKGKRLVCLRDEFEAVINNPQIKELTNPSKAGKSERNGFSKGAHYSLASRIDKLFYHAVPCGEFPDTKHGKKDVLIHRFACPVKIQGRIGIAWLTAKQSKDKEDGKRLYNLEIVDIEMLADLSRSNYSKVGGLQGQSSPHSASKDIVKDVREAVKEYFGESHFSLDEAKGLGLMENGVGVFGNAVVVEPGTDFDIEALHASPHLFPKFDTSFMGSGEGAQVYGWGLYFATRYGVNRFYHKQFSKKGEWVWCGEVITEDELVEKLVDGVDDIREKYATKEYDLRFSTMADAYLFLEALEDNDLFNLRRRANNVLDSLSEDDEADMPYIASAKIKLALIDRFNDNVWIERKSAINYKVMLKAEDDELLNWDDNVLRWMKDNGLYQEWYNVCRNYNDYGYISGKEVYKMLSLVLGSPKAASEWLLERGIKGIKYADGGSRGSKGEKYYNYVMFSGDDVVIEKIDRSGEWNVDFDMWENPSDVFGETNHSLLGEHAKTFWGYDEGRMFKGRDDGRLRVEIDSSVAGLREEWSKQKKEDEFLETMERENEWVIGKGAEVFREIVDEYGADFVEKWAMVGEKFTNGVESRDSKKMKEAEEERKELGVKGINLGVDVNNKLVGLHDIFRDFSVVRELCKKAREGEEEWRDVIDWKLFKWMLDKRLEARENGEFKSEMLPLFESLGDVFDFPELYEGYPELRDYVFTTEVLTGNTRGYFNSEDKCIVINVRYWATASDEEIESTILHELGHAVHDIEGWARGGSSEVMLNMVYAKDDSLRKEIRLKEEDMRWFKGQELTIGIDLLDGLKYNVSRIKNEPDKKHWIQLEELLIKEYTDLERNDFGFTKKIIRKYAPDKDYVGYSLPPFVKELYREDKDRYVDSLIESIKAIKDREREEWQRKMKKRIEKELTALKKEREWVLSHQAVSSFELYSRLAGEQESRAIQSRMGMSMEERMAMPFNESFDRSAEDTIVRFGADDDFKPSLSSGSEFSVDEVGIKSHAPGDESNFCIIGEGGATFREYEEAGLVYVDKADGKKKAILDSRGVKLKHGLGGVPRTGAKVTSLGALLDYPELYRAYPELKKLRVDLFRGEPKLGGYANPKENYIAVNVEAGVWTSALDTILHEVQHIIQGAEGFAKGANGSMDEKRAIAYVEKSIEQLKERDDEWAKEQVVKLEKLKEDIADPMGNVKPFFVYLASHGEREADMVGTIMGTNSVGVSMSGADATEYMRLKEYSIPVIEDITPLGGVTFSAGRFGAMGHEKLSAMGDKLYDEQVLRMRRAVERSAKRLARFKERGEENEGRERGEGKKRKLGKKVPGEKCMMRIGVFYIGFILFLIDLNMLSFLLESTFFVPSSCRI